MSEQSWEQNWKFKAVVLRDDGSAYFNGIYSSGLAANQSETKVSPLLNEQPSQDDMS